jgi:predicted ATPase
MRAALVRHDELLRTVIEDHTGMVFASGGDGFGVAFQAASSAVAAAVAAQLLFRSEPWPTATPIRVRMGVHTGEADFRNGNYFGTSVNRAARLMAVGHGGQVLVSGATAGLIEVALLDLGEHRLRDLGQAIHVFQVGEGRFPPLRSLDSLPGNLPLQVSSFVGRERELGRGVQALRSSRVVTLVGVGGVGKTRLALQLAAEVLPGFRDGSWLVELAPVRDPSGVGDAVAAVFGVGARPGQSVEEALVEFFRAKQMIVLLDNCEHVLEPVATLVDQIARSSAGTVILATSREGLDVDGEQIVTVPSLGIPPREALFEVIAASDAVSLFVQRARRVDDDFALTPANGSLIAQVCRRLDGIPLAIELAAARVRAMTPAELARDLDHSFNTLAGGRRGMVARHQTLRAVIDWSYDLLSEHEQRLLARLSVFAGGCSRDSAETVCAGEPIGGSGVFRLLARLVDQSLVVTERDGPDTRYRLLETIREYGEERLGELGEAEAVRHRHADHYAALAEMLYEDARGAQQPEALHHLAAENENLLAAMAHAIDRADIDLALRLLTASTGQVALYNVPLLPLDALHLEGALEHPLYPRALATAAVYAAERGDVPSAEQLANAALDAAARLSTFDPLAEYEAYFARARAANMAGAIVAEATYFEHAASVARSAGLLCEATMALGCAAAQFAMSGDADRGLPMATEALAISRQAGAPGPVALNLVVLAAVLARRDPEQAKTLLGEGIRTAALVGEMRPILSSVIVLVGAYMSEWDEVLNAAPTAIRGFHWTGQRASLAGMLNLVARPLAPLDPSTAAIVQGAVRRLAGPVFQSVQSHPQPPAAGRQPITASVPIADLRHQTTAILRDALGETRLRELRAEGEALEEETVVALTLDAIARARPTPRQQPTPSGV